MSEQAPRPRVDEAEIDCNRPFLESLDGDRVRVGVCVARQDTAQYRAYVDALRSCDAAKRASREEPQQLYRAMQQELPDRPEIIKLFTDCRPEDIVDYRQALLAAQAETPALPGWRRKSAIVGAAALIVGALLAGQHLEAAPAPTASPSTPVHHPGSSPSVVASPSNPTPQPTLSEAATTLPTPTVAPPAPRAPKLAHFSIASLNSLGASHTDRKHGNSHGEFPPSSIRAPKEAALIEHQHVDVIGLQEFQPPQRHIVLSQIGDRYAIYPTTADYPASVNSIMWLKSKFSLVEGGTTPTHYFGGAMAPMPWVELRSTETGQVIRIYNFHDPADTKNHPHQAPWRQANVPIHRAEAEQLETSGRAGFLTCDCNSKDTQIRHQDRYLIGNNKSRLPIQQLMKGNLVADAIRGSKIDHVFYTPDRINVQSSRIVATPGISDHRMVVADVIDAVTSKP